jgi:hypothetical protein
VKNIDPGVRTPQECYLEQAVRLSSDLRLCDRNCDVQLNELLTSNTEQIYLLPDASSDDKNNEDEDNSDNSNSINSVFLNTESETISMLKSSSSQNNNRSTKSQGTHALKCTEGGKENFKLDCTVSNSPFAILRTSLIIKFVYGKKKISLFSCAVAWVT